MTIYINTVLGSDNTYYKGVFETLKYLVKINEVSLPAPERGLWVDDSFIFTSSYSPVADPKFCYIYKYDKKSFELLAKSAMIDSPDGGEIKTIWGDETHLFVGMSSGNQIKKFLKSNLNLVAEVSYGGTVNTIWGDATDIYAGGATTQKIIRYDKATLTPKGQTTAYGGVITGIEGDVTHVYCTGNTTGKVRKYVKANFDPDHIVELAHIEESPDGTGNSCGLALDNDNVYFSSDNNATLRKIAKADLTTSASYTIGFTATSVAIKSGFLYIGGDSKITRVGISTLAYDTESETKNIIYSEYVWINNIDENFIYTFIHMTASDPTHLEKKIWIFTKDEPKQLIGYEEV
jgi:hypothetical protein